MIKALDITNFQSHKNTRLEFSKGFNVIVGSGDSGKTSSLRALNWVRSNRPLGDGFIRNGSEEAGVAIELMDEACTTITRRRGKTNTYTIHANTNPEDMVLSSFGSDTPKEVSSILNMDEINIQWQTNPYYLVYESAGQIALTIRETYGLDQIDKIIYNIGSKIRENNGKIDTFEDELKIINSGIQDLEEIDLDELKRLIDDADEKIKKQEKLTILANNLKTLINKIRSLNISISSIPEDLDNLLLKSNDYLDKYETALSWTNSVKLTIKKLKAIKIPDIKENEINEIINRNTRLEEYTTLLLKINNLKSLTNKLFSLNGKIEEIRHLVDAGKELIDTMMMDLTECSYCGSELNEKSRETLLKSNQ